MDKQLIFDFKSDISKITLPRALNNPFGTQIPEIARVAAGEFQILIEAESEGWEYDYRIQKGKMFGVLVVQREDQTYGYLGTNSGRTPKDATCRQFVPSIFDDAADDFFIDKGMIALSEITGEIEKALDESEIKTLKEKRRQKSVALQEQLFSHYQFLNILGEEQNIVEVFQNSSHGKPPSAAGECAAPKLLQYAFEQGLKPIALAEFWWGNSPKNKERAHKVFYPACKNKCRPILEYMLNDTELYQQAAAQPE
ncbi:MAG: tRNA pseudouridine32 synthase/23S rRNA pseudouridine746 synthase [Roseivirga sp.]|jgi:tRNA pseudouridine32 synthase/23S rRNA pseudouridine746 synthase